MYASKVFLALVIIEEWFGHLMVCQCFKEVNCYEYGYEPTSLTAVACWSFTPLKNEPLETPEPSEVPEDIQAIMKGGGFIDEDKAIDIEKIKKAFPAEMK